MKWLIDSKSFMQSLFFIFMPIKVILPCLCIHRCIYQNLKRRTLCWYRLLQKIIQVKSLSLSLSRPQLKNICQGGVGSSGTIYILLIYGGRILICFSFCCDLFKTSDHDGKSWQGGIGASQYELCVYSQQIVVNNLLLHAVHMMMNFPHQSTPCVKKKCWVHMHLFDVLLAPKLISFVSQLSHSEH